MPLDSTGFKPSIVRDLRAGREHLVTHGWCQHQTRDGMRACALGGIYATIAGHSSAGIGFNDDRRKLACDALQSALGVRLGRTFVSLASWNDEPERTVDDVLGLYDFAIEREMAAVGVAV